MGFTARSEAAARLRPAAHLNWSPVGLRFNVATAANRGFISLLLNWLWFLRPHGHSVGRLIILAEDQWTARLVSSIAPRIKSELRCEHVETQWTGGNSSQATGFGSMDYKMLMAGRPAQILTLLESTVGSTAPWVWADADAIFVSSPFSELVFFDDDGMGGSTDRPVFDLHHIADEARHGTGRRTHDPRLSAGFMALRNTVSVRALLRNWADEMSNKVRDPSPKGWGHSPEGNQNAYRKVWLRSRATVRTRALPGDRFINGGTFFVNHTRWPEAMIAHATHVLGLPQKIGLIRRGELWRCVEAAKWLALPSVLCTAGGERCVRGRCELRTLTR